MGGVLDDAVLVDYVEIHPAPEFLPDPGEIHRTRIPSCPLKFGDKRTEPLPHLAVQGLVEEFFPDTDQAHRKSGAVPGLILEYTDISLKPLPDAGVPGKRYQVDDGGHRKQDSEQEIEY